MSTNYEILIPDQPLPLSSLFKHLDSIEDSIAEINEALAAANAFKAHLRTQIERHLRESGIRRTSDDSTGYGATIRTTKTWRVTDERAVLEYIKDRPQLQTELMKTVLDVQACTYRAKGGRELPGVEEIVSESLVITKPKPNPLQDLSARFPVEQVEVGDAIPF